jgi:hypothetical protein
MTTTTLPRTAATFVGPAVSARHPRLLRAGLVAGVVAAAATTTIAAVAEAAGVHFETAPGDGIPLAGFAQMTVLGALAGLLLARVLRGRARAPRRTFTRTTVALTVLSVLPDLTMAFDGASRAVLVTTHVVAAAIVVPVLARRLPERTAR